MKRKTVTNEKPLNPASCNLLPDFTKIKKWNSADSKGSDVKNGHNVVEFFAKSFMRRPCMLFNIFSKKLKFFL